MRGRFAFVIVALAAVVLLASENTSQAGRRHRGCRSCGSCYSGCASGTCTAPAPAEEKAPEAPSAKAPTKAPAEVAATEQQQESAPTVSSAPATRTYFVGRRGWRRWRRR